MVAANKANRLPGKMTDWNDTFEITRDDEHLTVRRTRKIRAQIAEAVGAWTSSFMITGCATPPIILFHGIWGRSGSG